MLEVKEIYWLAGLMEGEGWFGLTNHHARQLRVQVASVDEDVIDRVEALLGGWRKAKVLQSGKTAHEWTASEEGLAAGLMMTLYSLLSERRQQQIRTALDVWKAKLPNKRYRTQCIHGHPLSGDNLRPSKDGRRRCLTCNRERMRKHRANQRALI